MSASVQPRRRLRTRLTLLLFLFSALPAVVISLIAYAELDELLRAEITRRIEEVHGATALLIDQAEDAVEKSVTGLATSEELRRLLLDVEHPGEGLDLGAVESSLERAANTSGLDLLALVELRPEGQAIIAASVHSPASMEKAAPPFARIDDEKVTRVGFAQDLAAGNPPAWVPAIIGVRGITGEDGHAAFALYGGLRLDTHRLESIATNGHARLVLESPNVERLVFPRAEAAREISAGDAFVPLTPLPNGRAKPAWATSREDETIEPAGPSRLSIRVETKRLEDARATFATLALALAGSSLLFALIAGAVIARPITQPILELASAAQKVGAGDLDVELTPRSDDEVGALVGVFNRMTRELADARIRLQRVERIAAWREIARRVAHEIKNPLSPIQMAMENLARSHRAHHPALDEIVEESTKAVLEEVRALNRIVTEFSELARLPAPRKAPATPLELLAHTHALYAAERGGPVEVRLDAVAVEARGLPTLEADRDQLGRVLINLVKNAIEALPPEGGTVTLDAVARTEGGRGGVELLVQDTGRGMTDEVLAQIFAPYFTTKAKGTGLGLAIVERIVQEHEGVIRVESAVGVGTTIRIFLPASAPGSSALTDPRSPAPPS